MSEKQFSGKVKYVATKDECWTNGKMKWWITKIHDEFKDRSEIRTIIGNLSSIKKDDDKIIVEDSNTSLTLNFPIQIWITYMASSKSSTLVYVTLQTSAITT